MGLYGVQVRRVCWPIKHSNYHGHWTSFWYLWQCGQVPSPAGKWNQHLHKACQQKEAWSALKFPGRWLRWLWTSENTVYQHQQMTWQPKSSLTVETSHWTSSNMDSVPLHSSSRLWDLDFQMKCKIYFHLKRGLWTTEFFLHSPGKTLLTLSLVQKWLGSPFPEDVWAWWLLMHWLQLQSTPCEALTSVWISFAWQYSQACGHPCCLCTFSYPNSSFQSTLHLICFDTALCKQPHLSVMTLCDLPSLWRASMFVFWIIAKSAVFSIIVVSKNNRYPEFILLGWYNFIKIKTKKLLKCFTLHAMNLKYMKVSLFEITYKKKWTFSQHSNLLRCTCIQHLKEVSTPLTFL